MNSPYIFTFEILNLKNNHGLNLVYMICTGGHDGMSCYAP